MYIYIYRPLADEPASVTKLFFLTNGRRTSDYTAAERKTIDALVAEIASLRNPWVREDLPGKS